MSLFRAPRPAPTAAQRQERSLMRGLYWVGTFALMACVTMTAVYGWNTGTTEFNKFLLAAGAALTDVAGALLMRSSGLLFARRNFVSGGGVLAFSVVCICISGLGIFGFQASNRVAVTKAREKIEKIDTDQLEWLRRQTVEKATAKGEKQLLLGEVKEQIAAIKKAPADIPDAQAVELALMLGRTTEEVQRWLVMGMAATVLFVQLACLWLYAFLQEQETPRRPPNQNMPPGNSGNTDGNSKKPVKSLNSSGAAFPEGIPWPDDMARKDVIATLVLKREIASATTLADRFSWSLQTTLRRLRLWEKDGLLRLEKRGNARAILLPSQIQAPRLVGGKEVTTA